MLLHSLAELLQGVAAHRHEGVRDQEPSEPFNDLNPPGSVASVLMAPDCRQDHGADHVPYTQWDQVPSQVLLFPELHEGAVGVAHRRGGPLVVLHLHIFHDPVLHLAGEGPRELHWVPVLHGFQLVLGLVSYPVVLGLHLVLVLFRVLIVLVEAPDPLGHGHEPVPLLLPEGEPLLLFHATDIGLLLGLGLQLFLDVLADPGLHQILLGGLRSNRGLHSLEDLVGVLDVDEACPPHVVSAEGTVVDAGILTPLDAHEAGGPTTARRLQPAFLLPAYAAELFFHGLPELLQQALLWRHRLSYYSSHRRAPLGHCLWLLCPWLRPAFYGRG